VSRSGSSFEEGDAGLKAAESCNGEIDGRGESSERWVSFDVDEVGREKSGRRVSYGKPVVSFSSNVFTKYADWAQSRCL
jgi:hypothetical protein